MLLYSYRYAVCAAGFGPVPVTTTSYCNPLAVVFTQASFCVFQKSMAHSNSRSYFIFLYPYDKFVHHIIGCTVVDQGFITQHIINSPCDYSCI